MVRLDFQSILFLDGSGADGGGGAPEEPEFFGDLNLDQVVDSLTSGREEYDLKPFLYTPLHDVASVRYRHEVFRDLEKGSVFRAVDAFAERMRGMRRLLAQAEKLHNVRQKERWFLDAVDLYCAATAELAGGLALLDLESDGFRAFSDYLALYTRSEEFASLGEETRKLKEELAEVRYCVHIKGNRVRVTAYDGEADYSAEVERTFAKFKQGAVKDHRVKLPDWPEMNHVEERVLECVVRLYPDPFRALDEYYSGHRDYLDGTIGAFDREVQLYIAYLEYSRRFAAAGLPFCYPEVSDRSKEIEAYGTFDLALANKLVPEGATVVCNDFKLEGPERLLVVTGPNQGGKTTFARMFGQLHYLASLGLPVPGGGARLFLPDRLYTHFEKEEDLATLRGKFEDELTRIHAILQEATSDSIIIMNESFASTTLMDARFVGTKVIAQIEKLGSLCVYVTFVDELASHSEATVSMASTVVPHNPAERTYKVVRKPADGLAYAAAIAEKYGLTYESVRRRVAR